VAFPDDKDLPAGGAQNFKISTVAVNVAEAFSLPEIFAGLGDDFPITAIMYMPETAVDEDYLFVSDQNDIRVAGKVAAMEGITITHSMDEGANGYFR